MLAMSNPGPYGVAINELQAEIDRAKQELSDGSARRAAMQDSLDFELAEAERLTQYVASITLSLDLLEEAAATALHEKAKYDQCRQEIQDRVNQQSQLQRADGLDYGKLVNEAARPIQTGPQQVWADPKIPDQTARPIRLKDPIYP